MLPNEHTATPIRSGPPRPQDATGPIPASANSFDMTSEDEIGDMLTLLAATGDAISMYAAGSRDVILGRVFSVDPEEPHFVMELNEGATLPPGNITFVTCQHNAKLQFRLSNRDWSSVPGSPQLIPMVFPETCAVLNRRATERVETPLGTHFVAYFEINGIHYDFPVYDFSLGGMGLRCDKHEAKGLLKGRKLHDVRLELEAETVILPEVEIRVTRTYRSFLCGEQLHLGCMFNHLTPETESQLKSLQDHIHNAPRAE